jgi:hypothetical protein
MEKMNFSSACLVAGTPRLTAPLRSTLLSAHSTCSSLLPPCTLRTTARMPSRRLASLEQGQGGKGGEMGVKWRPAAAPLMRLARKDNDIYSLAASPCKRRPPSPAQPPRPRPTSA